MSNEYSSEETSQIEEMNMGSIPIDTQESSIVDDYNDNENDDNVMRRENEQTMKDMTGGVPEDVELINNLMEFINKHYVKEIREMCATNAESINIKYGDIVGDKKIAPYVETSADVFLEQLATALKNVTLQYFPNYQQIRPVVYAHITELPVVEEIRQLRNSHLNRLIRLQGVVTRRGATQALVHIAYYKCGTCKTSFGPYMHNVEVTTCFECQQSGKLNIDNLRTVYRDTQRVTLQEVPGSVPSGSLPRAKEIVLTGDLIDSCKPGDEIDITGVYKNISISKRTEFPLFNTVIEACGLLTKEEDDTITEEQIKQIRELAKNKDIVSLLTNAVAPSIHGHEDIKRAVLLSLVGGVSKQKESLKIRGDVNVLLLGDPSTAKSQFLRFAHSVSGRSVIATGQGASGVGLTASVRRDTATKEWVLEGGALVLADSGMCCIDEFDKMSETDRVAIHEAMEQQSISISKAGIVASLHARCSIIAAANPVRGNYNSHLSFAQNVNLSDPIISRFDILCVVKDEIDEKSDKELGKLIVQNHSRGSDNTDNLNSTNPFISDIGLFKAYVQYAKLNVSPTVSDYNADKISQLYSDLRKHSMHSGIPITVRHIESIIRISEGYAKLRLSSQVGTQDIDMAIKVTLGSFLSAQKYSVGQNLRKKFTKYLENDEDLMVWVLKKMIGENKSLNINRMIKVDDFQRRLQKQNINGSIDTFVKSDKFRSAGYKMDEGVIFEQK